MIEQKFDKTLKNKPRLCINHSSNMMLQNTTLRTLLIKPKQFMLSEQNIINPKSIKIPTRVKFLQDNSFTQIHPKSKLPENLHQHVSDHKFLKADS